MLRVTRSAKAGHYTDDHHTLAWTEKELCKESFIICLVSQLWRRIDSRMFHDMTKQCRLFVRSFTAFNQSRQASSQSQVTHSAGAVVSSSSLNIFASNDSGLILSNSCTCIASTSQQLCHNKYTPELSFPSTAALSSIVFGPQSHMVTALPQLLLVDSQLSSTPS